MARFVIHEAGFFIGFSRCSELGRIEYERLVQDPEGGR